MVGGFSFKSIFVESSSIVLTVYALSLCKAAVKAFLMLPCRVKLGVK